MSNRLPVMSDPESGAAPGEEPESDLRSYLDLLRRRWWWVLGAGLVGLLGTWAYSATRSTHLVYTAEAVVQRLSEQSSMLDFQYGVQQAASIGSELEILRTHAVLGQVVDGSGLRLRLPEQPELRSSVFGQIEVSPEAAPREYTLRRTGDEVVLLSGGQEISTAGADHVLVAPGLALEVMDAGSIPEEGLPLLVISRPTAIAELDGGLRTERVNGTDLIRITFRGTDPALTAAVANNVARAYQEQAAARARQEAERRRAWIAGRLASVTDSLRAAQDMLLEFQAERQTLDPRSEGASISGMLADAQEQLRSLQDDERRLQEMIQTVRRGDRDALRQAMIFQGDLLPGGQGLYDRLGEYEERRGNLVTIQRRTENSPDVQLLDSLISETRAVMAETAEQSLRLARDRRDRAENRVAELRSQLGDVPERSIAFGRIQQRVERIQEMHDMLAESLYEAQIAEATEAGDVQIVDPALVPTGPSSVAGGGPDPLLGLVLGLLFGYAAALGYEKLDSRIRRPEEARRASGAVILGTIPALGSQDRTERIVVGTNGSAESEAFRMLRTNLRFARAEELRSIAVTSAGPREGKSVISANLALSLAEEGKKVLLVDCDLRRPVQHTVFGQARSPGLTDLLVGGSSAECILKLPGSIHMVPAGTNVPNPAELLGSTAFSRFLERAREHYDLVIMDTPPVLAVSDVSVIASQVDGILLVVRQEQTHREALASASAQLRRSQGSLLGVAVNGVRFGSSSGYYGYGYGYGASEYLSESKNGKPARVRKKASKQGG